MTKMKAAMAAVLVMEKEGVTQAFGVPGAAINPLYAQLRERQSIAHVLARHVEGASHMAEGYTRAKAGNIGVCIGTSGPAGTDMITGLYSAQADSIPILCITGQAPRARLHKEDFQAVDIASIAKPVTKWATTVLEPAQVPRAFQQAFHLMRSGRPGPVLIDLPFDVMMAEIEFDIDTYEPLSVYKPTASRKQIEKALEMLVTADRPLIVAGGGIINADASDLLVEFAELTEFIDAPVPRPLARIRGELDTLLSDPSLTRHESAWVQATLTDDTRPLQAMDQLRRRFPHTLVLAFEPTHPREAGAPAPRTQGLTDHEIALGFVADLRGAPATEAESTVLRQACDACCEDPDFDVLLSAGPG